MKPAWLLELDEDHRCNNTLQGKGLIAKVVLYKGIPWKLPFKSLTFVSRKQGLMPLRRGALEYPLVVYVATMAGLRASTPPPRRLM